MAKSEKISGINAVRLKFAREYYGLSISDVSKKTKITVDEIEKYENDQDKPTYRKLSDLANLYRRPVVYFFFQEDPEESELQVAFRKIGSAIGESIDQRTREMIEKANEYKLNLKELNNDGQRTNFINSYYEAKKDSSVDINDFIRASIDLSIEKQKDEIKRPEELLNYIRDKFYSQGIYIFKDSFKNDSMSGLCLYDEEFPVILINNKTTFTRQIFTVFHELYHLLEKETTVSTNKNEEKECDEFASNFLIPALDFQNQIKKYAYLEDYEVIKDIASTYKVSLEAVAYRLKKENKINSSFYNEIRRTSLDWVRKMNKASAGGNFYFTKISYLGQPYLKQVFTQYYEGKISTSAVGRYTGLKASNVSSLSSRMLGGAF